MTQQVTKPLILITGGTGKTGRRLADRLRGQGVPVRTGSRHGSGADAVSFDWDRPETWGPAVEGATAAYVVAPPSGGEASGAMIDFIRQAGERGVRRFVLLSASLLNAGDPPMGTVHAWLRDNAGERALEWAVMRPSWFMQNFSEAHHLATIGEDNAIYSATGDGRVAFVSADDIAASAAAALTVAEAPNADFILTGPGAVSYDEVAAIISEAAGRTIRHVRIPFDDLAARHVANGLPPQGAQILAFMDLAIADGAEDRTTSCVADLTGREPVSFRAFAQDARAAWAR